MQNSELVPLVDRLQVAFQTHRHALRYVLTLSGYVELTLSLSSQATVSGVVTWHRVLS